MTHTKYFTNNLLFFEGKKFNSDMKSISAQKLLHKILDVIPVIVSGFKKASLAHLGLGNKTLEYQTTGVTKKIPTQTMHAITRENP